MIPFSLRLLWALLPAFHSLSPLSAPSSLLTSTPSPPSRGVSTALGRVYQLRRWLRGKVEGEEELDREEGDEEGEALVMERLTITTFVLAHLHSINNNLEVCRATDTHSLSDSHTRHPLYFYWCLYVWNRVSVLSDFLALVCTVVWLLVRVYHCLFASMSCLGYGFSCSLSSSLVSVVLRHSFSCSFRRWGGTVEGEVDGPYPQSTSTLRLDIPPM